MQVLCRMCCRVAIIFITCQALRELFAFHLLVVKLFIFIPANAYTPTTANQQMTLSLNQYAE